MPEPRCKLLRVVIEWFAGKGHSFAGYNDSPNPAFLRRVSILAVFQALLRQDDTNGGLAEAFTLEMRHMQSKDPTSEANPYPSGRK